MRVGAGSSRNDPHCVCVKCFVCVKCLEPGTLVEMFRTQSELTSTVLAHNAEGSCITEWAE